MKINHTFLLILLLFISTISFAQNAEIDSLENVLLHHQADDTTKVNLLNLLADEYANSDINKSHEIAQEANILAKKINYKKGEARSYLRFSYNHLKKSEMVEAEECVLKAEKLYEEINYKEGITRTLICKAKAAFYEKDLEKAKGLYTEVLNIAIEEGDSSRQAKMLNNLGISAYSKGDFDEALLYLKKAQTIREIIGDKGLGSINNIAVICLNQGRYVEAVSYFNKCLSIYKENNDKDGMIRSMSNLSAVYYELKQYDKTLKYLDESFILASELENKRHMAGSLMNKGAVYADLKDFPKALDFMSKSLIIIEEINDKSELSACYFQLGDLHLLMKEPELAIENYQTCLDISLSMENKIHMCHSQIGLARAYAELKDYSQALHHALEGEKIAEDLELLAQQKMTADILATIYSETGKYKKAFESHQQFKILNDSLFNQENTEKIVQLEYEYKYKQTLDSAKFRELELIKEVEETEKDLVKSQRNSLLGIIVFLVLILALGFIIFFLRLRNLNTEAKNIMVEQKLLRSQMTPHFIFNSLSVLQGMILNKEDTKAVIYLAKFSKLLRLILENSRDKTVSLDQELMAVETYLSLQNIEETYPYIYTVLINDNIDKTKFGIPPMLIQPFIENAIEHAFGNQKENREIDIHLNFINEKLICTIKDNGKGIDSKKENANDNKKSLATAITSERLKSLSKEFKMKGSISIEDRSKYNEQGTIVTLVIPYKIMTAS